jgi:hypothetical protein
MRLMVAALWDGRTVAPVSAPVLLQAWADGGAAAASGASESALSMDQLRRICELNSLR